MHRCLEFEVIFQVDRLGHLSFGIGDHLREESLQYNRGVNTGPGSIGDQPGGGTGGRGWRLSVLGSSNGSILESTGKARQGKARERRDDGCPPPRLDLSGIYMIC